MGDSISLDADPQSVSRARHFCTETLRGWGADPDVVSTCELLVSELATNAVLHARTAFTVTMARTPRLRIAVHDDDPHLPAAREYSVDSSSGRGLHLVELLSSASGVDRDGTGKSVWFELDWTEEMAR